MIEGCDFGKRQIRRRIGAHCQGELNLMAMPRQLLVPRIPSHGQPSELMRSIELRRVIYWSAVAAIAVLLAYSPATALTPAAIATKRSTRRKNTTATAAKRRVPYSPSSALRVSSLALEARMALVAALAASRLQTRYRRLRDVEAPRYVGLCVSVAKALESFLPLVGCQGTRPSEFHAAILGALPAFAGTGTN
jgi:hypothetical protein